MHGSIRGRPCFGYLFADTSMELNHHTTSPDLQGMDHIAAGIPGFGKAAPLFPGAVRDHRPDRGDQLTALEVVQAGRRHPVQVGRRRRADCISVFGDALPTVPNETDAWRVDTDGVPTCCSDILTPLPALGMPFEIDDMKGPIIEQPIRCGWATNSR